MSYSILLTQRFEKEFKRLVKKFPSLKKEFSTLIAKLVSNPRTGSPLGHNCYKIRLAITSKGKGKRGGARVISYIYIDTETIYLLTIYDKGEKANLKPGELTEIMKNLTL